ncbi:MAG TPA: MBL fold metallo-hydrolase [Planctomycetota bacterium]|nr:MBL fold metallo-hydrolase [Planctomycetota bacterium]
MSSAFQEILPGLLRWSSRVRGAQQPVNSYLWRCADSWVIVDPAEDLAPDLLAEAGCGRVADVLITHFQRENAAGAASFPRARVHVPAGDEYLAAGEAEYARLLVPWPHPWEWETRGNFKANNSGAANERPSILPISIHSTISPGGRCLGCEVVSSPGHGKNAITLITEIEGRRVAFCGDLICGDGRMWNWFDCNWDYGLEGGPLALMDSVARLLGEKPDVLCPTHGPLINDPQPALQKLYGRLKAVLAPKASQENPPPINFAEKDSPAPGFREILPCLHQWRTGNCCVLVSQSRHALMIDDGLCYWEPLPQRAEHHRKVIASLKQALGIRKIEIVIPSHYHGDHTENISELVAMEGAEVVCLDTVAEPIEHPERFGLACLLPWYGAASERFTVHRKLRDGERFRWREFELEIFHLGGQTYYHQGVGATIDGLRTLFVGDSLSVWQGCEPVLCYNDAEPLAGGWPYAVGRMCERRPDLAVCGHGMAIRDPMPFLEQKRRLWHERLREFGELDFRGDSRRFFNPFLKE